MAKKKKSEKFPVGRVMLFRRSDSKFWQMRYTHEGKQYRESTKTSDKVFAIKIAQEKALLLEQINAGMDVRTNEHYVKPLLDKYFDAMEGINEEAAIKLKRSNWKQFVEIEKIEKVSDITPALVNRYLQKRQIEECEGYKKLSANTLTFHLNSLKHALSWMSSNDQNLILENPIKNLTKTVKASEVNSHRAVEVWELEKLVDNDTDYGFIWLLIASTGLRKGEFCGLKRRDINLETGEISLTKTKTGRGRTIPIPSELMSKVRELVKGKSPDKTAFTTKTGRKFTSEYLWKRFNNQCEKLKFDMNRLTVHSLRKTYCTSLAREGVDIGTAMQLMGHSDSKMTIEIYNTVTLEHKKESVEKLSFLKKFNSNLARSKN